MFRWCIAALLLMCSVPGLASDANVTREILWLDPDHTQPMFVPEEILNERSGNDFPQLQRAATGCQALKIWREDPLSYTPADFKAIAESNDLAVTGKVIGQVTGWSTYEGHVVTMIHVRVTEVLRDVNGDMKPGDVAIFRELHGDITVHGVRHCVSPQSGYYTPADGDEVLLVGNRWEGDARVVVSHFVYSVSGGQVAQRAFTPISHGAVTLESMRTRIGRDTQ